MGTADAKTAAILDRIDWLVVRIHLATLICYCRCCLAGVLMSIALFGHNCSFVSNEYS
jgi:hypothetical protein